MNEPKGLRKASPKQYRNSVTKINDASSNDAENSNALSLSFSPSEANVCKTC